MYACMWVCVCAFPRPCPFLHVSTRQLEAWPLQALQLSCLWKHGNRQRRKNLQSLYKNMVQLPLTHTHECIHPCIHSVVVKGVQLPHDPSSEACQTLTPLIICPDTEVWAGVITSEPWLLTQGPRLVRVRKILCALARVYVFKVWQNSELLGQRYHHISDIAVSDWQKILAPL